MDKLTLTARLRDTHGTSAARKHRREGFTPGVIYGEGKPASSIIVPTADLILLLRHHGPSSLLYLDIEGQTQDTDAGALIQEIQRDPVTREIVGLDFKWVSLTHEINVSVPVHIVGEAPGVTQEGGSLEQVLFEISVACLPTAIPEAIEVDVSDLRLGHTIHVSEVAAPAGVRLLADAEAAVVNVARAIRAEDLEVRAADEAEMVAAPETEGED